MLAPYCAYFPRQRGDALGCIWSVDFAVRQSQGDET